MTRAIAREPSGLSSSALERDARAVSSHPSEVAPGDIAIGVIIGRTSEYFDYFVYGIASVLVFPAIFFPFESRLDGTLWSFAIFSLAFIARPIGSMVFMDIQRRWGRDQAHACAISPRQLDRGDCLPARLWEPWLHGDRDACDIAHRPGRCPRRILGRIAVTAGAIAPKNRRGWYAMMGQLGAPVGFMIASGLYLLLSPPCRWTISSPGDRAILSAPSQSTLWPCSRGFGWS